MPTLGQALFQGLDMFLNKRAETPPSSGASFLTEAETQHVARNWRTVQGNRGSGLLRESRTGSRAGGGRGVVRADVTGKSDSGTRAWKR